MRGGILAAGILLLIFGLFLYFTGNNMMQEIEAYDVEDIPISEILKLVSQDARNKYEAGQQMVMFGSIFGIVGFILCIAGITAPGKKPQIVRQEIKHVYEHEPKKENEKKEIVKDEADEEEKVERILKRESKDEIKIPKYCSECGAKIEGTPKFCTVCGNKLR